MEGAIEHVLEPCDCKGQLILAKGCGKESLATNSSDI